METTIENSRRKFIGNLAMAAGATAGLSAIPAHIFASTPQDMKTYKDADEWFKNVKGSRKVVFDATEPHDGLPFIWPWVFYQTNNQTGSADSDMTAVVVLRHNAIPFAMEDRVWQKYNLGEFFGVKDNLTGQPSVRNVYYRPKEGDYPVPVIDGIGKQQERGIMYCVCQMALMVYSQQIAMKMKVDPAQVLEDFNGALLPGIQPVPSGVWALGRAQESGCAYIYAGG